MKPQKVDEIFGIPIYYNPIREKFTAKLNGRDYEADRLADLKRDLEVDKLIEVEEPVIYTDGNEMVLTTIISISPHGWLTPRERAGFGVSPNPDPKYLYPQTPENMKIFNKHQVLREKGWRLIHQAGAMDSELTAYPKNYWKDKAKAFMKLGKQ